MGRLLPAIRRLVRLKSADTEAEHDADPGPEPEEAPRPERIRGTLVRAVDGDTIRVADRWGAEHSIRLLSIDTPETHFFGHSQGYWGERAAARMAELLPVGCKVEVHTDRQARDAYGRVLGYVFSQGMFINRQMLLEGLAVNYLIYPNLRHGAEFSRIVRDTCTRRVGIFSDPELELPYKYRWALKGHAHAKFVGDMSTRQVYPLERFEEISCWDRIFFLEAADVHRPYCMAGTS